MKKLLLLIPFILFSCKDKSVPYTAPGDIFPEIVNVGTSPNDHTGDQLRTFGQKMNTNWLSVADSLENIPTLDQVSSEIHDSLTNIRTDITQEIADSLDQLRSDAIAFLTILIQYTYVLDNSVGGNDTYTATTVSSFTYTTGRVIVFHPLTLNTGACTLAINGGSAYAIKTQADADPSNSDMVATGYYPLCWDGANWVLMTK